MLTADGALLKQYPVLAPAERSRCYTQREAESTGNKRNLMRNQQIIYSVTTSAVRATKSDIMKVSSTGKGQRMQKIVYTITVGRY